MTAPTEAITVSLVRLALDAASMKHTAIANNIANANTPGHVRGTVDFDAQLAHVRAALHEGGEVDAGMLRGVRPVLERDLRPRPAGMAGLDLEAGEMAQNTVQYQALLKALNKHMSLIHSAVKEGRP